MLLDYLEWLVEEAEDVEEEEAEEDEEEKEVEKEEEEIEVEIEEEEVEVEEEEEVEEFNLGKSDDQRVRLPQPPALLLRPKITKLEIISKTDKDKFSILSQHPINARGFKGLNDKCSPISSLRSSSEFCSFSKFYSFFAIASTINTNIS